MHHVLRHGSVDRQRFSLQSLLDLAVQVSSKGNDKSERGRVGRFLLECVADRLAVQEARLSRWGMQSCNGSDSSNVIRTSNYHVPIWKQPEKRSNTWHTNGLPGARKRLETLQWIHTDTLRACREILQLSAAKADPYLLPTLTQVQARHARTVETLAELVVENLRPYDKLDRIDLNVFLHDRLGIQLLCEHYMEIAKGKRYGTIDYQRPVADALLDAMGEANILAQAYFEHVPEMKLVQDCSSDKTAATPIQATFVGSWLHYVLVEILKNAITATAKHHHASSMNPTMPTNDALLPPVTLTCGQDETITWIAIDDRGPGISTPIMDSFCFAQTNKIWDRMEEQTTYAMVRSPLQGLGVGLSLSTVMMQYFGGTLYLQRRNDGHVGTRAYLGLPRDLTLLEETQPE